jgi:hypothetical protein
MCRVAHLTAKAKGPAKPAVTPEVMSAAAAVTCTVLAIAGLTSSAQANGDRVYHSNLGYSILRSRGECSLINRLKRMGASLPRVGFKPKRDIYNQYIPKGRWINELSR